MLPSYREISRTFVETIKDRPDSGYLRKDIRPFWYFFLANQIAEIDLFGQVILKNRLVCIKINDMISFSMVLYQSLPFLFLFYMCIEILIINIPSINKIAQTLIQFINFEIILSNKNMHKKSQPNFSSQKKIIKMSSSSSKYYLSPQKGDFDDDYYQHSRLQNRIKSLKAALRASEQQNEQLHRKISIMKENHDIIVNRYQMDLQQQRILYEALAKKYQTKAIKLKQTKHSYRKLSKSRSDDGLQTQIFIQNLKSQNRALQHQLSNQNSRIIDLQGKINKIQLQQTNDRITRKQIQSKKSQQVEYKTQQILRLKKQKQQLLGSIKTIKAQNLDLKSNNQQVSKRLTDCLGKLQRKQQQIVQSKKYIQQLVKISEDVQKRLKQTQMQLQNTSTNYEALLEFSHEIQKQFQRQLHSIAKQYTRKQAIRKSGQKC